MAGFYLWHVSEEISQENVASTFYDLDYGTGVYLRRNLWNAVVFPKKLYNLQNYLKKANGFIFCVGSFGYKGKVYQEATDVATLGRKLAFSVFNYRIQANNIISFLSQFSRMVK